MEFSIQHLVSSIDMLSVSIAMAEDAADLTRLRCAAADHLTRQHGQGHWSGLTTERGVLYGIKTSRVLVARDADGSVGTMRLATRKAGDIERRYLLPV